MRIDSNHILLYIQVGVFFFVLRNLLWKFNPELVSEAHFVVLFCYRRSKIGKIEIVNRR